MYLEYWGLTRWPFEHEADEEFLFVHERLKRAEALIRDALARRRGAVLLTGPIGCGKTTLAEQVLLSLPEARFEIALVPFPRLSADELLWQVAEELGAEPTPSLNRAGLVRAIQARIMALEERQVQPIVCIDEAQTITDEETWETLRLLLGLAFGARYTLSLLLVGQSEVEAVLRRHPALWQRIARVVRMGPLALPDTVRYILFRLRKAGCTRPILTRQAAEAIHRRTAGVPRRINNLMDRLLLAGMEEGKRLIDAALVRAVAQDET